ncbi:MAG: 50S ribosomal protein L4 [Clostridia bacterium]|nr:50S ribosomal protein L4 [Clostridia bacterium]
MPKVDVYDIQGKKVSDVELSEAVFGIEPNEAVVHSVLVNYLANQRQGTQSTKTRSEVSGGGRKPWRQKGTGRARQGSIRAPQWIKGGIALGPKPRSYSYKVNKKEKQLAIKSLLSSKVKEQELTVVDKLELAEVKTKTMVKALSDLKVEGKTLIILADKNDNVYLSSRNIEGVKAITLNMINVYDLLKYNKLILPLETVKKLEEVYA